MSIQTTISMANKATPVLNTIINSLQYMINASNEVNRSTGDMVNTKSLKQAEIELDNARNKLQQLSEESEKLPPKHEQYNRKLKESNGILDGLAGKVLGVVSAYKAIDLSKSFIDTSDELALIEARLSRVVSEGENVADVQNQIYQSAVRSRADYKMTADIVGRLGTQAKDAFGNTAEIIGFAEQLNKQFVLSGTEAQGIESVMYNLSQAMSMGVLRGQDFNAVMSNTPSIAEAIAKEMGVTRGEVKALADDGKISANIVKNAMLNMAEETNAAFENMPKTWGQIATEGANKILMAIQPISQQLIAYMNTETFTSFIDSVVTSIATLANWGAATLQVLIEGFVSLRPILPEIATGIAVITATMIGYKSIMTIVNIIQGIYNAKLLLTISIFSGVVVAIGIIISALQNLRGVQKKQSDEAVSGMEKMMGVAYATGAVFKNVITGVVNAFNWAGAKINQGISFLLKGVLSVARVVDKVLGTDYSSSIKISQETFAKASVYEKKEYTNIKDAYAQGQQFARDREAQKKELDLKTQNIESYDDLAKLMDSGFGNLADINIDGNDKLKDIKDSVGRLDWKNNNLADLKGLMETRAINNLYRPVTLEVNNNISGNNISDTTDMKELAQIVSDKIFNDAQLILAGGVE